MEYPEKTLEVRLRSTETQPTYNICSRGGRIQNSKESIKSQFN